MPSIFTPTFSFMSTRFLYVFLPNVVRECQRKFCIENVSTFFLYFLAYSSPAFAPISSVRISPELTLKNDALKKDQNFTSEKFTQLSILTFPCNYSAFNASGILSINTNYLNIQLCIPIKIFYKTCGKKTKIS